MIAVSRNGHGCMLQYALLHLFGYEVSMDDLKNFRVRLEPAALARLRLVANLPSDIESRQHHPWPPRSP